MTVSRVTSPDELLRLAGVRLGGRARPAAGYEVHRSHDAGTGTVIGEVAGGTRQDALDAVESAQVAQRRWAASTTEQRQTVLRQVAAALRGAAAPELARLTALETGKRLVEAHAEVEFSAAYFDWYAQHLQDRRGDPHAASVGAHDYVVSRRPIGVVAVVTPYNYPLSIPARKIAPALAAGCAVVFKPSEHTPLTSMRLAELVDGVLPPGLVNTVLGRGQDIVPTWLGLPEVRALTFTGTSSVGAELARIASTTMTRCVLELGGDAPFLVLDDADLDVALDCLMTAKYRNNGQSCIAANKVFVPEGLFDEFVDRFTAASMQLRTGHQLDPATQLGPMAHAAQARRLRELSDEAEAQGVDVRRAELPSTLARDRFVPATVCVNPPVAAPVFTDELFGPIVGVRPYGDLEDVLGLLERLEAGLGAYVCTNDADRGVEVGRRLDVGVVGVNTGSPNAPHVPFGGTKMSGLGREGGPQGIAAFLEDQMIAIASDRRTP